MHFSISAVMIFVSLSTQSAQLIFPEFPLKSLTQSPVKMLNILAFSDEVSSLSDALFHITELMSDSLPL